MKRQKIETYEKIIGVLLANGGISEKEIKEITRKGFKKAFSVDPLKPLKINKLTPEGNK